jgi:hypothetical protein
MDSQHDHHISEPQQGKARSSEYGQTSEKEPEGNARGSLQQTGSDSRTNVVEVRRQGLPVVRSPKDLRVHPALLELDGMDVAVELNEAERVRDQTTSPILISSEGTVLSGFGHWRCALLHGEQEIRCIEYVLGQEDALQFILTHHRPRRAWNLGAAHVEQVSRGCHLDSAFPTTKLHSFAEL